jgi:hypothetical protein
VSADETKDREDRDAADETDPEEPDTAEPAKDEADEPDEPDEKPWAERVKLARQLWDAGDNARLRGVLDELEKAPPEEEEARALAADLRRRLKPDPVAIALWALTFLVFCVLTYLFVLR